MTATAANNNAILTLRVVFSILHIHFVEFFNNAPLKYLVAVAPLQHDLINASYSNNKLNKTAGTKMVEPPLYLFLSD